MSAAGSTPAAPAPRVEPLRLADVPDAVRLSDGVGWNQNEADWRRLLELHPEGVFGVRIEGRLVATATLASYGSALHWIGMVIVDAAARGRGLGGAVLDAAVRAAGQDGVVGLDATDLGVPLYRRRGFETVATMERWGGVLRAPAGATEARPTEARDLPGLVTLDRREAGVDRGTLLRRLAEEDEVRGLVVDGSEEPRGFAFVRPGRGRAHLGPVVARDDDVLVALLAAAARALAGAPVFVDAVRHEATARLLARAGLEPARRLDRMTHGGAEGALDRPSLRAATGLEWG